MRLEKVYIKTFTLWLAFVWASVSPLAILAQADIGTLPAKFRQVAHLDEITSEGTYLIGAEYAINTNNQQKKVFCLLTDSVGSSTLVGTEPIYPLSPVIEISKEYCLWAFHNEEDGLTLYSPSANKGVALKRGSSTSLTMSTAGLEKWALNEVESGLFVLQSKTDASRALGLNWYNEHKINFGLYKMSSVNPTKLRIYKKIVNIADVPGEAVMPADGSRLSLVGNHQVLAIKSGNVVFEDVDTYLLENGSLAYDATLPCWVCRHKESDVFLLENAEGKGLENVIDNLPPEMEWRVDNGHIITNETQPRYLVRIKEEGLALVAREHLEEQAVLPILFLKASSAPTISHNSNGLVCLQGGWSGSSLSNLDWTDVQLLDLTKIDLPVLPFNFDKRPMESNALVLLSDRVKAEYLQDWKNVVVCSEGGSNVWKNVDILHDREPWAIDREVKINKAQLTYRRSVHTDGNWETIYLPFDAILPDDFELSHFERKSEGNVLIFQRSQEIIANEPMLIRYKGPAVAEETVSLELQSKDGWLKPATTANQEFSGTYVPFEVSSAVGGVYFLNMTGDTFVRAASGSRLAPFRAAFWKEDELQVLRLQFADDEVTGLVSPKVDGHRNACYSLDGKLVSSDLSKEEFVRLPKGIYIIDGKKFLK